jgi:hypothetical protein
MEFDVIFSWYYIFLFPKGELPRTLQVSPVGAAVVAGIGSCESFWVRRCLHELRARTSCCFFLCTRSNCESSTKPRQTVPSEFWNTLVLISAPITLSDICGKRRYRVYFVGHTSKWLLARERPCRITLKVQGWPAKRVCKRRGRWIGGDKDTASQPSPWSMDHADACMLRGHDYEDEELGPPWPLHLASSQHFWEEIFSK